MKKYLKNCGISASIIATANINIISKTGPITIVLDGVEYKSEFKFDENSIFEYNIYNDLINNNDKFTNNGKKIEEDALRYILITKIESEGYTYDDNKKLYNFAESKPLKIHLKSKDYIKIEYTGEKHLKYQNEYILLDSIINNITIKEIFEENKNIFKGYDCGVSKINNEGKNSTKMFKEIDGGEVTITIDSSKIKDKYIRKCFLEPVGSIDFIKSYMLDKLNWYIDFNKLNYTISSFKTALLNNFKFDKDGNNDSKNGKPIITGPFKIKIDGKGNEIESTAGETDLSAANYIHLIVDKNTINPYFLKKELKFYIIGGKDNYIISDEIKNKIQGSLNNLKNAEEVTEELIFEELKKLENDVFIAGGVVEKNIKCYKTGENIAIKNDFGIDITVKIDPKAISSDKIKIKLTLGDIKNNENINLDSAVVTAINDKLKAVNFGISIKDILAILNDNALKSYFTEALVEADILDNNGNVLGHNVSKNSTIKIKADKIKSEYFKKAQEEEKDKNNDEKDENSTQNGDGNKKRGCCGGCGK